jgi:hypothetical protein
VECNARSYCLGRDRRNKILSLSENLAYVDVVNVLSFGPLNDRCLFNANRMGQ